MKMKTQLSNRILSLVLALVIVLGMMPMTNMTALAAAANATVTIDTGASVTLKDTDGDNFYEIGTADELYAFAALVNRGEYWIKGELTANIVVNQGVMTANSTSARVWTPIGNDDYYYTGTFDGNNYTISGLYFNDSSKWDVGLFGFNYTGTVRNTGVINSYFCGSSRVGGVAGQNSYGLIENCYNTGAVNGTTDVGGVVGLIAKGTSQGTGTVQNCYNTGAVSGTKNVGGVVGYVRGGIVKNCYNTGAVNGTTDVGGVVGVLTSSSKGIKGEVTNCYYLETSASKAIGSVGGTTSTVVSKDTDAFKSGEVAWLLNGSSSDGVWKQTINKDSYPNFTGLTVYYVQNCQNGNYSNAATAGAHIGNATCTTTAVCSTCGTTISKDPNAHNPSADWSNANGYHYHSCLNGCSTQLDKTACFGGTATCASAPVCSTCGKEYGSKLEHSCQYSASGDVITEICKNDCGYEETATLVYDTGSGTYSYTGTAIQALKVEYSQNWQGGALEITYQNNTAVSTDTTQAIGSIEKDGAKATQSFTIVKGTMSGITVSGYSGEYDGEAHSISITEVPTGATVTYSTSENGEYTATNPSYTEEGSYTVWYKIEKENYETVAGSETIVISQTTNSWTTTPSISGWTYGENANEPSYAAKFGTVKVEYRLASGTDADYSTTVPTQAGSYLVHFSVEGNENYTSLTEVVKLEIAQVKLTVTADNKNKTYGENDPALTWQITEGKLVGEDVLTGISISRVEGNNANTYTITASQAEGANPNYDITFVDGTFTINQREIEIEWTNTEFTYDGNEKLPTATAKNLVTGDTCNITVAGGKTDAGTGYVATAESVDNNNYKLPSNNTTTFVIKNASQDAPVVTGVDETIYGKRDGKITGLTAAMEYRKEGESTYTAIQSEELTNLAAGTYYVRYAEKANYNASADTTVVIGAGRMLKVSVVNGDGYTITVDKTEFEYMGGFTITLTIAEGYSKTEQFDVLLNGSSINWSEWVVDDVAETMQNTEDTTITVVGVADVTAPEVEMSVKGVGWKQFINKVTFGLFFKENVEIEVEATDLGSKIKTAEYLITETAFTTEDAVKNDASVWTTLTLDEDGVAKFNVTENGKKYVYVRVTDNAGNITVVSSDGGTVVYTDSTADTTAISFTKTTTDDVTAKVNLNGNTVKAIYNGTDLVDSSNYSVAADGTITFKAAYLDTLAEGTYTLHIVYDPQGETYVESDISEAPANTNITLNVDKQTGTVSITNDISKTYDGSAVTAPTYDRNNVDGTVVVVYKQKGADDNTYSTDAPKNAGDYTVRVTVKADDAGFYTEAVSAPVDFTIGKATLTVTAEDKTATYGDAVPTYTEKYDGFAAGEDKNVLGDTLNLVCDYAQFSDKGEYTIKASGYTSDNYNINYVDGKLTVNAKPITVTIQNATSIYGDTLAELKATDEGIINGDANVYSIATTATSTSNVGKYAITGTALDSNYEVTFVNGEYEITKREITITVEAKNTIVNTALPTYTYKVEGLLGEDKLVTEPTLTSDADITVIGEYEIVAKDADAGNNYSIKYVPAKLTILTDDAVDAAAGYAEELKDYDTATVTSEDKAELEEMLSEIDTILADETTTDNGKKALEEVKEKVEELIKEITDAEAATDTENTEKVKDVTAENVTPDNKTDLEGAKADLEKALDEHGNNMTEEEKKAIEDEIKRINDALEVIGNVEAVEELIDKLPENITKDDEAAIKAADDAYNALTDYEKSLVDKDAKKSLDDAKAALAELNKPADTTSPNTGDNSNMFLWIALLFISGGAVVTLTVVDRKKRTVANK